MYGKKPPNPTQPNPLYKDILRVALICPYRFQGTSVLFLYRNVKETVISFMRVMAAFTTLARFFTSDQVCQLLLAFLWS